jgi:ribulose 1,5-bisphosphate carboxylase large subunit-like protein
MKRIQFNINNHVYVRLTPQGRKIEAEQLKERNTFLIRNHIEPIQPVEEDGGGWSRWQLWQLMETFGQDMHIGCEPPFETEIIIEAE